jgi:hypothetical protein
MMSVRLPTAIAALSWLALAVWALSPPWRLSAPALWMPLAYLSLHLAVAGLLYARGAPAPVDPAWPARLRLVSRRTTHSTLRAVSFGGRLLPVVVVSGPWASQPPEIRRALLAHEAAHLEGNQMLWLPALFLSLVALLPTGFGSVLLASAVCATINRRLELAADRRAARLVDPAACRAMLAVVGEDPGWARLVFVPILCLLMTHPPLRWRLAACAIDSDRVSQHQPPVPREGRERASA